MSLNIRWGTTVHPVGDSITVQTYWLEPGGLMDQMNAAARAVPNVGGAAHGATFTGNKGQVVGPVGIVSAAPEAAPVINFTAGAGGNSFTIQNVSDNYATFVTPFQFQTMLLECVVNDFVSATPQATHLATYGAFLDRVHADYPRAVIFCLGAFMRHEQWSSTPSNHFTSGLTGNVWDANVATLCAARPGWTEYIDQMTATLAYEVAHNTPEPGVDQGILTIDNTHPNSPTGRVLMGTIALPHMTFSI